MSEINPLFSKPVYENKLDIDTKTIVSMIDKPRVSANWKQNNQGNDSLYVLEHKKFDFLKDIIEKEILEFTKNYLKYTNNFKITTSWFTKVNKKQSSQSHNHNNCFLSGVLYLKTSDNSGNIVFTDYSNERNSLTTLEYNLFNSKSFKFQPYDGLILIFPSELYHHVETNNADHIRYSLAFNIMPTGLIGKQSEDSQLRINL
tara:strand:+ start:1586 stop:2191 length:606 start_codon:yes stop_codon:yes gene_type:complete